MLLVVETGQGLQNANSYISESYVADKLPSATMPEWNSLTIDEKNDRLVVASQFIDISFQWIGKQKTLEQGLSWPRTGVVYQGHPIESDTIPNPIKRAVMLALILVIKNGIDYLRSTGEAQVKREKMVIFETEYFEGNKADDVKTQYSDINNILKGFYTMQTGGIVTAEVLRA